MDTPGGYCKGRIPWVRERGDVKGLNVEGIIKTGNLQSGGQGEHRVHRREGKGQCQGGEDTNKTKKWNPWEGAKVSMEVPRGGSTSKGGMIRGKAKVSTGEGTNGENANGTFSMGIPKGVMATENT